MHHFLLQSFVDKHWRKLVHIKPKCEQVKKLGIVVVLDYLLNLMF